MNIEEVKIELTNYCKRMCIHCSSDANTKKIIELDFEKVKNIIEQCSNLGVKSIVLTGGEATEYKDIKKVINYIKSKKINNIKLYTMCEPTTEKYNLLKELISLGLTEVIYSLTISLTTDGAVTYDNIEEFLIKISQITNLSFHYCLTTKTIEDIDILEKLLFNIGYNNFTSISFLRYVEHGRGKDNLTLSSADLKKFKPKIISLMQQFPNKIRLGSPFNILNVTNTPCTAGSKTIIIGFDGNVYPCDAMKYFDYLGIGGSIYSSNLQDIYQSNYFQEIRRASNSINEYCNNCKHDKCKGGCLAQKMLEIIKREETITTKWYQENALRTMNNFENENILKLNAYTGIIGEYGEFFDYIKKLYTHNLSSEKKQEILKLAPKEIGDLVWYLSTSLAISYNYTLDEVYEYILNLKPTMYKIDANLIYRASQKKDPLCPFKNKFTGYNIDAINQALPLNSQIDILNEEQVLKMVLNFKKVLNKLDYIETKEDAIKVVADILLEVAKILKILFNKNLSEVLNDNIEKLRKRYPNGFSTTTSNLRIDAQKKYKVEEEYSVPKTRILSGNK